MHVTIAGRTFRISRFVFLLFMGALVGAITGVVTVIFRKAAFWGEEHFFPHHGYPVFWPGLHEADPANPWLPAALKRVAMPLIGGAICGFVLYKLCQFKQGHSIPTILRSVAAGKNYFQSKMALPPALALVTLATGGSVGPEGPIAEIGSVTGSLIGRIARIPPKLIKTLIGSGVAAGIAAVFNAPIGGVFFAFEVILRNYEVASLTPILIAAVVASVISQAALGDKMAITFPDLNIGLAELPLFVALGLFCGLLSIAYIHGLGWTHDRFNRLKTPLWVKPAIGGLSIGVIGVFFPAVMGEGYDFIRGVIDGSQAQGEILLLLVIMLLKILGTGLTLGSGNPGGSFAPAVFIGVMGGAAFGTVLHRFNWVADPAPYAVMGMAGLIAGALGAPITAIMITMRHGGANSPELLLPLMTTVALCLLVMQPRRNVTVYTLELLRLGIDLDRARRVDPLSLVGVRSVTRTSGWEDLPASMPVHQALERFRDGAWRWFVVRDEDEQFVGIVSLHEMRLAIAEEELAHLLLLSDISDAFQPRLQMDMNLNEALVGFNASDAEVLPVFESAGVGADFVGVISRQDALNAYYEFTEES